MFEMGPPLESMTPEAQRRMKKYGHTLDAHNVQHVIDYIEDYPEIVHAAATFISFKMCKPEFDPDLGGD